MTTQSLTFQAEARSIGSYDLIVAGGGPAGTAAAVAAARQGCKTLLVEATGSLGGAGTTGNVLSWLGFRKRDNSGPAVAGIFAELVEGLVREGNAIRRGPGEDVDELKKLYGGPHIVFDIEACKRHHDRLVKDAGAEVLFFTQVASARRESDGVGGVFLFNKDGITFAEAKFFIDCTGDADLANRAGFETTKGRDNSGNMAPSTVISLVEDVDREPLIKYLNEGGDFRFRELVKRLRDEGTWTWDERTIITFHTNRRGVFMINSNRQVGVDGTCARSLSDAMMEGRAQAHEFLERVLKPHYPGFKNARLRRCAETVGVRETRQIVGEYTLSEEDCATGKSFPDTVALSGYGWDLPDPKRPSHQPNHAMFGGKDKPLPKPYVEVPFGCLIPKGAANLLAAGRCVSTSGQALGPVRIMATCYAMGQAAGTAAALCLEEDCRPQDLSIERLREKLLENGAVLK